MGARLRDRWADGVGSVGSWMKYRCFLFVGAGFLGKPYVPMIPITVSEP